MSYILDTNIFIRSKNEMPIDLWPSFWGVLSDLIQNGQIYTSEKVKEEIDRGNDDLTQWVNQNSVQGFCCPIDVNVTQQYSRVLNWAISNPVFSNAAKIEFSNVADAYLVATAAANNMTVVTFETSDPNCKKRVKIPDACIALGVTFCDLNTLFRQLGVTV